MSASDWAAASAIAAVLGVLANVGFSLWSIRSKRRAAEEAIARERERALADFARWRDQMNRWALAEPSQLASRGCVALLRAIKNQALIADQFGLVRGVRVSGPSLKRIRADLEKDIAQIRSAMSVLVDAGDQLLALGDDHPGRAAHWLVDQCGFLVSYQESWLEQATHEAFHSDSDYDTCTQDAFSDRALGDIRDRCNDLREMVEEAARFGPASPETAPEPVPARSSEDPAEGEG